MAFPCQSYDIEKDLRFEVTWEGWGRTSGAKAPGIFALLRRSG